LRKIRGTGEAAGVSTGRFGSWVYRCRTPLRVAAVIVAVLVFAFWGAPTGLVVAVVSVLLLVGLGLIELLGRPTGPAHRAGRPRFGRSFCVKAVVRSDRLRNASDADLITPPSSGNPAAHAVMRTSQRRPAPVAVLALAGLSSAPAPCVL